MGRRRRGEGEEEGGQWMQMCQYYSSFLFPIFFPSFLLLTVCWTLLKNTFFSNHSIKSICLLHDEVIGICHFCSFFDFFSCCVPFSISYVFFNRSWMKKINIVGLQKKIIKIIPRKKRIKEMADDEN